jgi:hypothetical protein
MIKYKWTPLQLLALVSITLAICDTISIARMKGESGLGGLAPMIYGGIGVGIIIIDVIIQTIFRNNNKAFMLTEVSLLLAFVIWIYSMGGI